MNQAIVPKATIIAGRQLPFLLQSVAAKARVNTQRRAVRAGLKPCTEIQRSLAPRQTGTLRRSIAGRVSAHGPGRTKITGKSAPKPKYTKTIKGKVYKPSLYAHLVVKGRRAVNAEPGKVLGTIVRPHAGPSKPNDYTARAAASAGPRAVKEMERVIVEQIVNPIKRGR